MTCACVQGRPPLQPMDANSPQVRQYVTDATFWLIQFWNDFVHAAGLSTQNKGPRMEPNQHATQKLGMLGLAFACP